MRKSTLILIALFVAFFFTSCEKDYLEVSQGTVVVDNLDTEVKVEVSSNLAWSIASKDIWCKVSPTSGVGSTTISVKGVGNADAADRSTVLTITAGEGKKVFTKTINVSQPFSTMSFSADTLFFGVKAETKQLDVKANCKWVVSASGGTSWINSISPTTGKGDAKIEITTTANTKRMIEVATLSFFYSDYGFHSKVLVKDALPNLPPDKPKLLAPTNGATGVSAITEFSWSCSDPDGDNLSYTLYLSKDKSTWKEYSVASNNLKLTESLGTNATWYWKVKADDLNKRTNSVTVSDICSFTTGNTGIYKDGEYRIYMNSTKANPIKIFFMGDGYVEADFLYGEGQFDKDIEEAIEAFFSIEPYKSYREYFTAYIVAGISKDRGMSITSQNIIKNTCFGVTKTGASNTTSMTCKSDDVFAYAKKVPGMTDGDLNNTTIVLISNEDVYGGTCLMWSSGRSIGISPVSRKGAPTSMTYFHSIVMHESGGHGWGRLADEYINEQKTIPQEEVDKLIKWQGWGAYLNVAPTNDLTKVSWSDFVGLPEYSARVGAFQGGYYYSLGIWRSEQTSCMINNMHYYNAASRRLIVKRILEVSGEGYTFQKFLAKDVVKAPTRANYVTKRDEENFIPLGPPILMD